MFQLPMAPNHLPQLVCSFQMSVSHSSTWLNQPSLKWGERHAVQAVLSGEAPTVGTTLRRPPVSAQRPGVGRSAQLLRAPLLGRHSRGLRAPQKTPFLGPSGQVTAASSKLVAC